MRRRLPIALACALLSGALGRGAKPCKPVRVGSRYYASVPPSVPHVRLRGGVMMPILAAGTGFTRNRASMGYEAMVSCALAMGYNHIDTSEVYPSFRKLGGVLNSHARASYFLTTKVDMTTGRRQSRCARSGEGCEAGVTHAIRASLRMLQLAHADLILLHRPPRRDGGGHAAQCARIQVNLLS